MQCIKYRIHVAIYSVHRENVVTSRIGIEFRIIDLADLGLRMVAVGCDQFWIVRNHFL